MMRLIRLLFVIVVITLTVQTVFAQSSTSGANTITTAVPFLSITPDSRAGAMGDAGVALSPDVNSQHWNPAKYVFMESDMGVGLAYSPWLRNLVDDINLAYLAGYKKIDEFQSVSASLRYFTLGEITFMDETGIPTITPKPNEFAIDIGYSRLLSEQFSGAVAIRYIRSDLTAGQLVNNTESHAGNAFAADVAFYYQHEIRANRKDQLLSAGINIQNIGSKISYTDGTYKDFIPTNLKLGVAHTSNVDDYNSFTFSLEANKLLVPTPPGNVIIDGVGASVGRRDSIGTIAGIFKSFTDAPGGFKEEIQEINLSVGVEYWYNKQFAVRAGYFYENEFKGNRKYFTAGAGLQLNVFALDFSYLLPTQRNHPLENTLRFSLLFDIDAFNQQR